MMSRRGLTLVELLLALVLLASLSVVGVDWAVTAARLSGSSGDTARWNASAQSTLDRIAEDVTTGDFRVEDRRPGKRLWIEDDRVTVMTRESGAARVVYAWSPQTQEVTRRGNRDTRLLLGGVTAFVCEVEPIPDPEDPDAEPMSAVLTMKLSRTSDHTVERQLVVPAEWLP